VTLPASVSTQRQIFLFWLPLAASWLLMGVEVPVLQAAIARLADMQTQLAAFGIVMSVEIAIESPVIMLLATSTALSTGARNYFTLRRFMLSINVLATGVALVVAFTPVYDLLVRSLMGIPSNIADAAQPGMRIMTLWTAAIGVRRFYQGVMIRHGQTSSIGYGTAVRLFSSGGTGILLALTTHLPGVYVGSIALMVGVITEAAFVAFAVRGTVKRLLTGIPEPGKRVLSMGDVVRYHAPLAATSLLTLLAQPLIGAGLARMPYPQENLAAWPVVWGIVFMFRSPTFALQETVIALIAEKRLKGAVWKFCRRIGLACSGAMMLVVATPLAGLYIHYVAGLPEHLSRFVAPAVMVGLAFPFINSIHSWLRGLLMAAHSTKTVYWGMGLNLAVTAILVISGALVHAPGAVTAIISLTAALIAEILYLRKAGRALLAG
jgi:hypothetical protein